MAMTSYLNVDLDIAGARDLAPLVRALGRRVIDLYTGRVGTRYHSHLELASLRTRDSADATITKFIALLDGLPPLARYLWRGASQRDFNIGIQGGVEPRAFELAVRPETLKAVARLGARIVVTVYAVEGPERRASRRRPRPSARP